MIVQAALFQVHAAQQPLLFVPLVHIALCCSHLSCLQSQAQALTLFCVLLLEKLGEKSRLGWLGRKYRGLLEKICLDWTRRKQRHKFAGGKMKDHQGLMILHLASCTCVLTQQWSCPLEGRRAGLLWGFGGDWPDELGLGWGARGQGAGWRAELWIKWTKREGMGRVSSLDWLGVMKSRA